MKKNLFILIIAIIAGLSVTYISKKDSNEVNADEIAGLQASISEKILRFHVLANSNSTEDQELKLKVKEYIASYIEELLDDSNSLENSIKIINENNAKIVAKAENFILSCGYDYDVEGIVTTTYFPIKSYGDVTLPAGDYLAYEIIIGDGNGANWWCILYPPLCFVDLSTGIVPEESKKDLETILDSSEYALITTGTPEIKEVRFKYLTFLNDLFNL